jgi:hypothetical protein
MVFGRRRREVALSPVRQAYVAAFDRWHAEIAAGRCSAYLPFPPKEPRPFPAPQELLPDLGEVSACVADDLAPGCASLA